MASQPQERQSPPITKAGVCALIHQLDADEAAVQRSGASDELKERAIALIKELKLDLKDGLDEPGDVGEWVNSLRDSFAALTPLLKDILSKETGRCFYMVGDRELCIQTTHEQCDKLGGTFEAGQACPTTPPA
jgi:hypothetical protein